METMMMANENYPVLYRRADAVSSKAQEKSFLFNKLYLGSLVLGSTGSALAAIGLPAMKNFLYVGLAVILVVGLLLLWVMRARQDDKIWFDGRAVAESVKTLAWRYMMRGQPFHRDRCVEALFLDALQEIREARSQIEKHLAAAMNIDGCLITDFMKERRSSSLEDRRKFYCTSRIRAQKKWYADKAKWNVDSSTKCFWVIVFLQIIIVIFAIVQATSGGQGVSPVPILTTFSAALTAWCKMKRYDELTQSYTLATHELEAIEAIADKQMNEEEFMQLIEQAENSISREHTLCQGTSISPQ